MANQRFRNSGKDPDFDLDEYIHEKSSEGTQEEIYEEDIDYPKPTARRNIVAILSFVVLAGVWIMTGGPASIFNVNSGNDGIEVQVGNPIENVFQAPQTPLPPPPPPVSGQVSTGYLDYLQQVNEQFPNQFSGSAVQGMYNGGVPIDYLVILQDGGFLDDFSYSGIIGLFNGGVPVEYLEQMNNAGYLDDFSYSGIIGLYNGGVPTEYLDQMNSAGYLDDFSYSGVIGLFNGGVPISYLEQMNAAGYLDDFSYSGVYWIV
ncbi:MAG: hypothetical protein BalsKO_09770 [Balneolaceae bacterium]